MINPIGYVNFALLFVVVNESIAFGQVKSILLLYLFLNSNNTPLLLVKVLLFNVRSLQ